MKRFLAFGGLNYYPIGGMGDFLIDGDTEQECLDEIEKRGNELDWAEIYDQQNRALIWIKPVAVNH